MYADERKYENNKCIHVRMHALISQLTNQSTNQPPYTP